MPLHRVISPNSWRCQRTPDNFLIKFQRQSGVAEHRRPALQMKSFPRLSCPDYSVSKQCTVCCRQKVNGHIRQTRHILLIYFMQWIREQTTLQSEHEDPRHCNDHSTDLFNHYVFTEVNDIHQRLNLYWNTFVWFFFQESKQVYMHGVVRVWPFPRVCILLGASKGKNLDVNLLKPTGHVMHLQFNIQKLYVLPTLYLCVLYLSENKQRLVPLIS